MQVQDIADSVEEFLDVSMSKETAIQGVREALNWMSVRNFLVDTITKEFEGDTKYKLPPEYINVIKVEKPEKNELYFNYKIDGNMIRFKDEGTYRIYAIRSITMPDSMDTNIDIHPMLLEIVKKYLRGYVMVSEGIDKQQGRAIMYEMFPQEISMAVSKIKGGQKSPAQFRIIRS